MSFKPASRFIDIIARKPSGFLGKLLYENPRGHYKSFRLIIEQLQPATTDTYCEIGCGGGALLEMVLEQTDRAAAVDISPDMILLAEQRNQEAISQKRLEILEGTAYQLPWDDKSFSCAGSANMFFFLKDPIAALQEIRRVLTPGGRLAIATHPKGFSWWFLQSFFFMNLYTDNEMEDMAQKAGFENVTCRSRGMNQICLAVKKS